MSSSARPSSIVPLAGNERGPDENIGPYRQTQINKNYFRRDSRSSSSFFRTGGSLSPNLP
jgi:hypothetical protein